MLKLFDRYNTEKKIKLNSKIEKLMLRLHNAIFIDT